MKIKRQRIFRDLLKDFRKRSVHDAGLKSKIKWVKFKMCFKKIKNTKTPGRLD